METDRLSRRRYDVNPFLDELAPAYQENEYKLRYYMEKVGRLALNTTRGGHDKQFTACPPIGYFVV